MKDIYDMELDLDMYRVIYMLFDAAPFWLALILITWLALLPDILYTVLTRAWAPNGIDEYQVCFIINSLSSVLFLLSSVQTTESLLIFSLKLITLTVTEGGPYGKIHRAIKYGPKEK